MLELEFMRLAFAVGIVVGVLAPTVGFFLVERRQSLVGDGLGHVAFAGVAAGYLLGISPVLTALCFAVVGAFAIEWLRSRGGTSGDQALALVFYTGIALGIVLISSANRFDVGLFQFLFGSILTVTPGDLWVVLVLGGLALAAVALLYRGLVAVVLDEEGSRVAGAPVALLNTVVAVLAALTVGISMRIVGILLIAALMVLPVIAAQRVAWSLRSTLALSAAIGLLAVLVGAERVVLRGLPARRDDRARRRRRGRPRDGCRRGARHRQALRRVGFTGGRRRRSHRLRPRDEALPGRAAPAVDDLTLTDPAGEICVLVGPSGGGKTTAMKMVNRLMDMTEGDIRIGGRSVRDRGRDRAAARASAT